MPGQRWRTPPSHPAATHPSSAAFCVVWVSCHVNVGKCCTYERHGMLWMAGEHMEDTPAITPHAPTLDYPLIVIAIIVEIEFVSRQF